jgi:hypothetical protein
MVLMGGSACEGAEVDESIKRRPEVDESIKRRPGTVSNRGCSWLVGWLVDGSSSFVFVEEWIKRRPGTVSSRGHCICRGVEVPVMTPMSDKMRHFIIRRQLPHVVSRKVS